MTRYKENIMQDTYFNKDRIDKNSILKFLEDLKPKLEKDGIVKLGLFGSFAKGKADNASDVDIVICTGKEFIKKYKGFEGIIYLEELRQSFSHKFKRNVDLCDIASMKKEKQNKLLQGVIYV